MPKIKEPCLSASLLVFDEFQKGKKFGSVVVVKLVREIKCIDIRVFV